MFIETTKDTAPMPEVSHVLKLNQIFGYTILTINY